MTTQILCRRNYRLPYLAGILLLAFHPMSWLVGTWIDPAYDSRGGLIAALVVGLFIWSLSSPKMAWIGASRRRALVLLTLTAMVRLAGQLLGVNVIGAVTLVVDLYALGLFAGVSHRRRPLDPAWLAVLFAFSLPLERVLQRTFGFGLQQLSAAGACRVLELGPDPVACEGVRILLAGQDVLVDLPCSGARGLLLLLVLFAALAALIRPAPASALTGLAVTLVAAIGANIVRIVMLALGLAYSPALSGISVMEAPWHEGIGLFTLVLGATPIIVWAANIRARQTQPARDELQCQPCSSLISCPADTQRVGVLGVGFVACAAVIVSLPARPVDVARKVEPPSLPITLAGFAAAPGELSTQEQSYFTLYGGSAARATYGPYGLLVVSTSAPLRHLHAPDECLAGSGHRVRYLGASYDRLPTAIYRSIDPQGRAWRVAVTFVSDRGELASSVTEAVWRWLQAPESNWTMVQRIAPWAMPEAPREIWDMAVSRALDLSHSAVGNPV